MISGRANGIVANGLCSRRKYIIKAVPETPAKLLAPTEAIKRDAGVGRLSFFSFVVI